MNVNERIRALEVRVIGRDGQQLGILPVKKAIELATQEHLDLVEVAPNADPPVCKIMDYGKFKYEESKKKQQAKKQQVVVHLKEIKMRPSTDEHDYQTKLKHVRSFLEDGDRVKITIRFRGREMAHKDIGQARMKRVIDVWLCTAFETNFCLAKGEIITNGTRMPSLFHSA